MNRLQMIKQLFNNDKDHLIGMPERTSTRLARILEENLQNDIRPVLQLYEDGLIYTAEFIGKLLLICEEEINL
jgi:hypothetical protein